MSLLVPSAGSSTQVFNREGDTNTQPILPVSLIPNELLMKIFSLLPMKDLSRMSCVCRQWNVLASDSLLWNAFDLDLKKLFPSLKILDETVWKTHVDLASLGLSVDDADPLDKRSAIVTLWRLFSSLEIEENAGMTLLTLPKGLTFNKLATLAQAPIQGFHTKMYIARPVLEKFGNLPIEKTHRVIVTNGVLKQSRGLLEEYQEKLLNEIGCKMPEALPVATLAILTCINTPRGEKPTILYEDKNAGYLSHQRVCTYTICSDRVDDDIGTFHNRVAVGGFISPLISSVYDAGLQVICSYSLYWDFLHDCGVGAMLKI